MSNHNIIIVNKFQLAICELRLFTLAGSSLFLFVSRFSTPVAATRQLQPLRASGHAGRGKPCRTPQECV